MALLTCLFNRSIHTHVHVESLIIYNDSKYISVVSNNRRKTFYGETDAKINGFRQPFRLCLQAFEGADQVTCRVRSCDRMEASLKTFTRSPHTHTTRNPFHNKQIRRQTLLVESACNVYFITSQWNEGSMGAKESRIGFLSYDEAVKRGKPKR